METIRKLNSKMRRLESDFSALEKARGGGGLIKSSKVKEDEALITELYDQISKYKSQVSSLTDKVKSLEDALEKKKRENDMMKRSLQRSKPPSITPSFHKNNNPNTTNPATSSSFVLEIHPAPKPDGRSSLSPKRRSKLLPQSEPVLEPSLASKEEGKLLNIAQNLKAR